MFWILQVFVSSTIVLAFYTITFCGIEPWLGMYTPAGAGNLCFFWTVLGMMAMSYFRACTIDPGHPLNDGKNDVEMNVRNKSKSRIMFFNPRNCDICDLPKPPRTHHCKQCNTCVLRMDHHCPFINACVGFYNYKAFLLFLLYTIISCVYANTILMARFFVVDIPIPTKHMVLMTILAIISLPAMLCVSTLGTFQYGAVSTNYTTIEYLEIMRFRSPHVKGKFNNTYDLGFKQNMYSVFGTHPLLWLIPTRTPGDGNNFPTAD